MPNIFKNPRRSMLKILAAALFVFGLQTEAFAQTPLLMPIPEQQFFNGNAVCSGCFVYTYISGSFTPQQSFTDATGLVPNTNPIVLNSNGYPQTSIGAQVGIWLSPTATYRIVLQNAAHVVLYQVDGITGQLPGSLNGPLSILQIACNQMTIGTTPNLTGLCFPAPSGAITLTFPATTDFIVGRNTTDTLANKTLTTPLFNGTNCGIQNGPGTYVCIANANPTGTTCGTLATLINAPSQATIAPAGTQSGIQGVAVANCGASGTATIQQSGNVACAFDGATVANHYVQMSSSVAGDCHDAGTSPANGVQVIGQVLSTNGGPGSYTVDLAPPGIISPTNNPLILPNDTSTGTLLNGLAKQAASLTNTTTAIRTSTSDTGDVIGIVNSGAGLSGSATIQQIGFAQCVFDGATTVNDYVIPSIIAAGNCHDSGVTYPALAPANAQTVGQVLSTNGAGGTYGVNLYGPSVVTPASINAPQRVAQGAGSVSLTGGTQAIILTESVVFPSTPGTYRAHVAYGTWITSFSNICAAYVVDTTNTRSWAFTQQFANGISGIIGLGGAEISSQTYAAGATVTFTLQALCQSNATATQTNAAFALTPNPVTFLEVTPVLSN